VGVRALLLGELDLPLGDERAGERRDEQVIVLVDRARLHRREDELRQELLAQVLDDDLARAALDGLLFQPLKLLPLAEVGGIADDLTAVVLNEPGHDDRRVLPAGLSQYNL